MVLSKNGFDHKNKKVNICNKCNKSLICNKLPKFSLANDLFIGDTPSELQELSPIEEALIQIYRIKTVIYKIKHFDQYRKIKGNIITFMNQEPLKLLNVLPDLSNLKTIQICLCGSELPKNANFDKMDKFIFIFR